MPRKVALPERPTALISFETKFHLASDKLRNNVDLAEHKHLVSSAKASFAAPVPEPR